MPDLRESDFLFGNDHRPYLSAIQRGEDNIYNFQCCCRQCNALKQDWTMNELYEKTVDIFWYQTRKRTGSEYTDMLLECIRKTGPRRDL